MKKAADSILEKDEWTTFGNFVADNIKKLKPMNQLLAKRNITNWLLDMQMKEMEANMIEERRLLPHKSPVTSEGTFESENSSLSYPVVEGRSISPSPVSVDNSGTFEGLKRFFSNIQHIIIINYYLCKIKSLTNIYL